MKMRNENRADLFGGNPGGQELPGRPVAAVDDIRFVIDQKKRGRIASARVRDLRSALGAEENDPRS